MRNEDLLPQVFIGNAVDVERKDIEATVQEGGMIFMEIMSALAGQREESMVIMPGNRR